MFERMTGYGQRAEDGLVEKLFVVEDEIEHKSTTEWLFGFIPYRKQYSVHKGEARTLSQLRLAALEKIQEVKGNYINIYIEQSNGFFDIDGLVYRMGDRVIWSNGNWASSVERK